VKQTGVHDFIIVLGTLFVYGLYKQVIWIKGGIVQW